MMSAIAKLLEKHGITSVVTTKNPATLEVRTTIAFLDQMVYQIVDDDPNAAVKQAIAEHDAYLWSKKPKHASHYHG